MSGTLAPINTSTLQIGNGATAGPTSFGYYPGEGSRVASTQYNFSTSLHFYEDLQNLKAYGVETAIQSIWVDNSNNPQPVTIVIAGSNQQIVVPNNSQGIFPAFFSDNAAFYISCSSYVTGSTAITKCCLLNIPANTAGTWNVYGVPSAYNASGLSIPNLVGTKYYTAIATSSGTTTIIPASANQRFFLTGLYVTPGDGVTIASAGYNIIAINDGSNVIFEKVLYIPAASAINNIQPIIQMSGLNIISNAVNQSLNIYLSNTITTEAIYVSAFGGYTQYTP